MTNTVSHSICDEPDTAMEYEVIDSGPSAVIVPVSNLGSASTRQCRQH
jgi:hypothetical protein